MKRLNIFGFHIWISREPLKVSRRDRNRNCHRNSQRNLRLKMVDNRCEICGKSIGKNCHMYRVLPIGTPNRNLAENVRVLCGECWHEFEKRPHIHGYQHMEDNTRYEA